MLWKTLRVFVGARKAAHDGHGHDDLAARFEAQLLGLCLQVLRSRQEERRVPEVRRPAGRTAVAEQRPAGKICSPEARAVSLASLHARQQGPPAMTLNFPNASRSFDETRNLVRFWGYDSALEICFFVEAAALVKLMPESKNLDAGCLEAFDAARERIFEAARRVYVRGRSGPYLLAAADF